MTGTVTSSPAASRGGRPRGVRVGADVGCSREALRPGPRSAAGEEVSRRSRICVPCSPSRSRRGLFKAFLRVFVLGAGRIHRDGGNGHLSACGVGRYTALETPPGLDDTPRPGGPAPPEGEFAGLRPDARPSRGVVGGRVCTRACAAASAAGRKQNSSHWCPRPVHQAIPLASVHFGVVRRGIAVPEGRSGRSGAASR